VHFDAERRHLVDLAVELAAIPAVDVGKDMNRVLDLAARRLEDDHAFGVHAIEQLDARARARLLGQVGAGADVEDVAANDVAPVGRHIGHACAHRDLVHAGDRRIADVRRLDAL
jgi:hypothetical protein